MPRTLITLLLIVSATGAAAGCQTEPQVAFVAAPATVAPDEPTHLRVTGLAADEVVTITARAADPNGQAWTSSATFTAGPDGTVDLDTAEPVRGSYYGVSGMGPFWSMTGPSDSYLSVWDGYQVALAATTADGAVVAETTVARSGLSASVRSTDLSLSDTGFRGIMFEPTTDAGLRPAVLVFGGSEGGLVYSSIVGAFLASHGHPSLVVAYHGEPGLPSTLRDVPLEYFVDALDWLRARPGVDRDRVYTYGVSRGGEAALLLAARFPDRVHGAVSLVGANVVGCAYPGCDGPAWTLKGKPVPYTREFSPAALDNPAAIIPVEAIVGPVLVACAGQDEVWRSCGYAQAAADRLRQRASGHLQYLTYPGAGHFVGGAVPYLAGSGEYEPVLASATEQARAELWPAILTLLGRVD